MVIALPADGFPLQHKATFGALMETAWPTVELRRDVWAVSVKVTNAMAEFDPYNGGSIPSEAAMEAICDAIETLVSKTGNVRSEGL